jgi:histidinol phosphatase-like enzyme
MTTPSPAVFLDRDGTLHDDAVYMVDFAGFRPIAE